MVFLCQTRGAFVLQKNGLDLQVSQGCYDLQADVGRLHLLLVSIPQRTYRQSLHKFWSTLKKGGHVAFA